MIQNVGKNYFLSYLVIWKIQNVGKWNTHRLNVYQMMKNVGKNYYLIYLVVYMIQIVGKSFIDRNYNNLYQEFQ